MAERGGKKAAKGTVAKVSNALAWVYRVEKWVAAAAFGVMTLFVLSDILLREIAGKSFPAGPKIGIFLMIWGGFLGASLTSAKGAHLRAEAALKLWPKWSKPAVETIEQAITALFCGFFGYLAIEYVAVSKDLAEAEAVTEIPLWIIQLVIPYTFVSMAVRHSLYTVFPKLRPVMKLEDLK